MIVFSALLLFGAAIAGNPEPRPDVPASVDVATCVVDNDIGNVRALLKTVPGSPAEGRVTVKLIAFYGGCNDNRIMSGAFNWHERAELAEAAVLNLLARKAPNVTDAVGQSGWAFAMPANAKTSADYDAVSVGVRMMGDCLVRTNPQGSLTLLRSERGSAGEASAINELSGNIASCVPGGQLLKLKRTDLRLVVAEPLYHVLSR